ncbi:Thioredoxin family protein [Trichomonas vaginalis G3]|uniref:Thioredoxin family protein n=1 Tax=Trichomonas vaginalis (strain ATCC PRA-98 / G3) TaxID=412133 RepID=A2DYY1_TRIV3|nr:disulfide-isomerase C17h9.14C-related family [Trichomonas vaginalis G3]EAY14392.1 Thioredoxin family protein [Trichomonas vaginalis G3]KAI5501249.1 disulfide-isomerase C17h9.14C-related family [Trichomonas vaginalis G3]|eukprot:XP_001326615.1 Thioredoxin family protein [Trichomonas vaginalis G3]
MICFFLLNSLSVNTITLKNYQKYFTEAEHKPILVTLISQWCQHCYQYKPIKEKIESHFSNNKNLTIATINCDSDTKLCDKFPGTGTPRIYFTTSSIEKAEKFEESRTYEEVKAFIERHIEPTVIQIKSKEQLANKLKENINTSIFICQDLSGSHMSDFYLKLANKYNSYPVKFLNLTYQKYKSADPIIAYYYSPAKIEYTINSSNSFNKIERFILEHIYPPFGIASKSFFDIQVQLKEPFLVIEDTKHKYTNRLISYSKDFPEGFKSVEIDCTEYTKFCKEIEYDPEQKPWISIVNLNRKVYYHFKGDFSNKKEFVNWVSDSWNGITKEEGIGAGFQGKIRVYVMPVVLDYVFWIKFVGGISIIVLLYKLWIAVHQIRDLKRRCSYDQCGFK